MKKKSAKQTVRGSLRATKKLMSKLGGRPTAASGAWLEKGDGRVPGKFRVETKCPPTGKYRFTFKEWQKLYNAAISAHEVAVFHLKLHDIELMVLRKEDYVGFGGAEIPAYDIGIQLGHTLSRSQWHQVQKYAPRLYFAVTDGPRGPIHNFFAVDLPHFLKLTKESS